MKTKKIIISLSITIIFVLGIILGTKDIFDKNLIDNESLVKAGGEDKKNTLKNSGNDNKKPANEEDSLEIQEPRIETVSISAVGDIMTHMPQVRGAYTGDVYDFYPSFEEIKYINDRCDISMANLETVLGGADLGYSGFPRFNSPDELAVALKDSGFDIISTANNHTLDQGKDGIIRTIDVLYASDLENIGTFKEKPEYFIKEVNGIKIGMLAYTYGLNGMDGLLSPEDRVNMIGLIDDETIKRDIEYLKDKVDITLIYLHWGLEYSFQVSGEQVDLADKIFQWGGDIILGSHPHVVQKYELREDGKYVIYSMGNFLSNQREKWLNKPYVENGLIVELTIEKDFNEGKTYIKDVNHIPTWVYMYHDGSNNKHKIIPIENGTIPEKYLELGIGDKLMESYNETMDVLEGRR